jgi:hypothetical protein
VDQHKTFRGNKLIIIGIESVPSTHKKGSALPINKVDVDISKVKSLLKPDTLVVLIFKEVKVDSVLFDRLIIGDVGYHNVLIHHLKKIDLQVLLS